MSISLLLDLDDTLLQNSQDRFISAYLKELGSTLSNLIDPHLLIQQLLSATDKMIEKDLFPGTLEMEFSRYFYPSLAVDKEILEAAIDAFYCNEYQNLRTLTASREESVKFVESAFSKNDLVVVATNPLFPAAALNSRLEWGELSPAKYPFSFVTDYSSFHFSKPNPSYYAEILAQLGRPDQPAFMIGNSLKDDIIPALHAGIPSFLFDPSGHISAEELPAGCRSGTMSDAEKWIDELTSSNQCIDYTTATSLLASLQSTPAAVDTFLKHLPESSLESVYLSEKLKGLRDQEIVFSQNPILFANISIDPDPRSKSDLLEFSQLPCFIYFDEFCSRRLAAIITIKEKMTKPPTSQEKNEIDLLSFMMDIKNSDDDYLRSIHSIFSVIT